jgi:hypothetical protein
MVEKEKKGGFLDNLFRDCIEFGGRPETHSYIETHIIRPMMVRVFRELYPYLLAVLILWVLMFVCLAVILVVLLRGSAIDAARIAVGGF